MNPASRKWLGLAATLVALVSLVVIYLQSRPPPRPPVSTADWFYDLNTGELFAGPLAAIPPIAAPSGPLPDGSPAGVRAHVYGCGGCSEAQRTIAYLETYSLADQHRLRQLHDSFTALDPPGTGQNQLEPQPGDDELWAGRGSLVRRPADLDWVSRGSEAGLAVTTESLPRCPAGIFPLACQP